MHYVYVLQSEKDGKLYIGLTTNLKKRVKRHNQGHNTSTRSRRPFILIYYEAHLFKEDARRREHYFKTAKGKSTLKQMLRTYFSLESIDRLSGDEWPTLNHVGFRVSQCLP